MTLKEAIATIGSDHPLAIRYDEAKVTQHFQRSAMGAIDAHIELLENKIIKLAKDRIL